MFKYSIVIPIYNSGHTIIKAIQSCFDQTYGNYEIILIDDCSVDGSIELIEKLIKKNKTKVNIRIIRLKNNCGPSFARNIGWNAAKGDYIAFLDSDDAWLSQKLEIIDNIIRFRSDIVLLGHDYFIKDGLSRSRSVDNAWSEIRVKKRSFMSIAVKNITQTSCIIVKTNIPSRFDETMTYVEDHDLWLRIADRYPTYYYPEKMAILGRAQLTKGGLSGNTAKMRLGEIKMYLKIVSYRRSYLLFIPFLVVYSLGKHIIKGVVNILNLGLRKNVK